MTGDESQPPEYEEPGVHSVSVYLASPRPFGHLLDQLSDSPALVCLGCDATDELSRARFQPLGDRDAEDLNVPVLQFLAVFEALDARGKDEWFALSERTIHMNVRAGALRRSLDTVIDVETVSVLHTLKARVLVKVYPAKVRTPSER